MEMNRPVRLFSDCPSFLSLIYVSCSPRVLFDQSPAFPPASSVVLGAGIIPENEFVDNSRNNPESSVGADAFDLEVDHHSSMFSL